jgi:hypothetical protein
LLARRWTAYWHRPGFELSYFVCRLACLLSIYLSLDFFVLPNYDAWFAGRPLEHYKPVGPLFLFGRTPPEPIYFDVCRVILKVALVTAMLGLFTRLSFLAIAWCYISLTALLYSFSAAWSHGLNPQVLIALSLAGGPPHTFTLGNWIRQRMGWPATARFASSGVLLGQFTIAWVFANAGLYKLVLGNGEPFAWCYSDNMRNVLLYQHWAVQRPFSPTVQFLVEHPWAWKAAAWGNVILQIGPLLAMFLTRRPLLRALCGLLMVFEVVGLEHIMHLANWHWLPLFAFFVDWDRLGRRVLPRESEATPDVKPPSRPIDLWIVLFAGAFLFVSLVHRTHVRWTYPFTSFPMYSPIMVKKPYTEHRSYPLLGTVCEIEAQRPLTPEEERWLWTNHRDVTWRGAPTVAKAQAITQALKVHTEGLEARRMTVRQVLFEIQPYPDNAVRPSWSSIWLVQDGSTYRYVDYTLGSETTGDYRLWIEPKPIGFRNPKVEVEFLRDFAAEPVRVPGRWAAGRYYFNLPDPGKYVARFVVDDPELGPPTGYAGPGLLGAPGK